MAEREIKDGHVYYFEPNDIAIGKDQNGDDVSLMPHLEDLCISMSLTADMFPRDKASIPTLSEMNNGEKVQKRLAWISYISDKGDNQFVGGAGIDMNGENYLTTYYTEIGPDSYIENEMVEGLGVASVDISFESWYTPTITIKFIDVHGSALWGREEAIHTNGRITGSNVLGIFFTQPYPLFRLQVKGFLGHSVTYQLTVSSFKGRYNSQTGNFEVTVTFIGYSYSLLTDIPLELLSVVPEMTYVGKRYWETHLDSPSWQIHNADKSVMQPIPLFVLIDNIRSAVGSLNAIRKKDCEGKDSEESAVNEYGSVKSPVENEQVVSLEAASIVSEATNATNELNKIQNALDTFVENCEKYAKSLGGKCYSGYSEKNSQTKSQERQLVLMINAINKEKQVIRYGNNTNRSTQKFLCNDYIRTSYIAFNKAVEEYNKAHPDNKFYNKIKKTQFHNNALTSKERELKILADRIFIVNSNQQNKNYEQARTYNNVDLKFERIFGKHTLNKGNYEAIKNDVQRFNCHIDVNYRLGSGFGEFLSVIPLGSMYSDLEKRFNKINRASQNVQNAIENKIMDEYNGIQTVSTASNVSEDREEVVEATMKKKIIDIIGFEPTIGNFVKLLMCHLETFIEIMFVCGDNIYRDRSKRTPKIMGIPLEDTDITTANASANSTSTGESSKWIYPWPGLYNPNCKNTNSETPSVSVDENKDILGWPLDYSTNGELQWEEGTVVCSFMDAVAHCKELVKGKYKNSISNAYDAIPMSGMDLSILSSPFDVVGRDCTNIEKLAAYLGLRIASTIGVSDNKCDSNIAKAIGSIDAINLIQAYNKPTALRNAIISKDGSLSFAQRVIDYITCNVNSKNAVETDNGKVFNHFETKPKGTCYYNETRHPIFKVNSQGSYNYTYTYTKGNSDNVIPIIPSELKSFGNNGNPYGISLNDVNQEIKGKKYNVNMPSINDDGNQWWVYNGSSDNLSVILDQNNYVNNQMLNIITDEGKVNNFISHIETLKEGLLTFGNYNVKGVNEDKNVKDFIERRYHIGYDEYSKYYFNKDKNYHVVGPLISEIDADYANDHLCFNDEQKNEIVFDNQWCYDTNSKLYEKLTLTQDGNRLVFKNKDKVFEPAELNVNDLPIMINSGEIGSLFGSHLYYLQNEIEDEELRRLAKVYLIVSSMMAGINTESKILSSTANTSIIESLPPFYVLFIGALIWRNSLDDDKDLYFGNYFIKPDKDTSLISRVEKILYADSLDKRQDWIKLKDLYKSYNEIDCLVKNKLINIFKTYAFSETISDIIQNCELTTNEGKVIKNTEWQLLLTKWSSFDEKKTTNWTNIFGDFSQKYSSVALPTSKKIMRLLISENNKSTNALRFLYGLNAPFIVGRATTQRISDGTSNEIKVTKEQMMSYLIGFEERIKELKNSDEKTEREEILAISKKVSRDHAINLYYSLKHLWDTWLISAARDQFTIENFFNKYFIFIDSFYVNAYNTIKLNPQVIENAYNTKDQNLLTYITNITSEEGCMFLALPDFVDSNVYADNNSIKDFSWKRNNLKKMFTPLSYNEMNPPLPSNVFVFVYTHKFSDNAHEITDKTFDSYMITDKNTWPIELKKDINGEINVNANNRALEVDAEQRLKPNNSVPAEYVDLITSRYGYMMPCFGVTVNRGNNYIFKSINVNMDSPKTTFASAQNWADILYKTGADGTKRIFFHGQDIYSIYSKYSYACEIEMMGCAQLQPLMYFQLLNIPMWRGTYMIYKVTHNMTPGSMTTKFTGMKMSRKRMPYADGYFVVGKEPSKASNNKDKDSTKNNANNPAKENAYSPECGVFSGQKVVGGERMVSAIVGTKNFKKTSDFMEPRKGYYDKKGKWHKPYKHKGVDIAGLKEGTPYYAPWDGIVDAAKPNNGQAGNSIQFSSSDKRVTIKLFHCKELKVKTGDVIMTGGLLGTLGNTGHGSGPHLHLELYINDKLVNPMVEVGGL